MHNLFIKPFLADVRGEVYFPYTREKLCERPMFPTYVFDGGAAFFGFDKFGTINSDLLLEKVMDGSLFTYWERSHRLHCRMGRTHLAGKTVYPADRCPEVLRHQRRKICRCMDENPESMVCRQSLYPL